LYIRCLSGISRDSRVSGVCFECSTVFDDSMLRDRIEKRLGQGEVRVTFECSHSES
jgi:hypothetical protein